MIDPSVKFKTTVGNNNDNHSQLSQKLRNRLELSQRKFADAHKQMGNNEEQFRAYIPETDADKVRKNKRDSGLPQYTTINIPYSYAQVLATHTYITSVFLSRNPVFQYSGRHGESQQQEQCIEALMAYQMVQQMVPLYIWLLDPGKYGYGIIGHYWDKETVRARSFVEEQPSFLGMPIPGAKPKKVEKVIETVGYEGNRLYNVRPQDFLSDPRVSMSQFQSGEFCARYVEITGIELARGVASGKYFNYEAAQAAQRETDTSTATSQGISRDTGSSAVSNLPNSTGSDLLYAENTVGSNFIYKGHEIYVRLVPKAWGVGTDTKDELWVFTRLNNGIVIGAQPLPNWHGKFPFDLLEDEVDGYNLFTKSGLEQIKPLNDVMNWLVNTHFYNVRAALNNQFVVDPSMIVMKDAENPAPGMMLRLKPSAYGRDVRSVISQFPVADVTASHIPDMQMIAEMIQRSTGVNDNIMGMLNSGGRKTATEVRSSSTFGINRLKTKAEYFSAMGFSPLAQKLLQNTQQFYTAEKKFRIVGDLSQFSPGFVNVTPEDIVGFYDFEPVDGTLPIDRFAQANLWGTLLGQMRNFPQILMTYDIAKIFGFVASLGGLHNVSQFRVQVQPDEMLQNSAQAGNVIPLSGKSNLTSTPLPEQIPNVGASG